jgi:ABC-2 type transport system ATP-binding protein
MRILTCTLAPSAGTARVAGHDVISEAQAVRRRIGFMPEHVPLYPDSDVRALLRFVADLKGVPRAGRDEHLAGIEARTGLTEVRHRLVGHLSKGFRQRVGLAQALVGDPPILILDEPSAGLDPQQVVEIRELIRACRGQKTVLLSSHILNEVSLVCQRVLILDRGRLVAEESPQVLAERLGGESRVRLAWDGPREAVLAALAVVPGVQRLSPVAEGAEVVLSAPPAEVRPRLVEAVVTAGGQLQHLEDHAPSLEDLYLQVTGREPEEPA